ncbi:MAG: PIN domain-containing protein [Candidatus Methanoperedens sp.]|nr:PIN domain-containing protein [Candidatus Methanoperedens sp.]
MDTNVWLERLLEQERSQEVGNFLDKITSNKLFITDFAFHSIGVIMSRLNKNDAFLSFVDDIFINGAVTLVRLEPEDMQRLVQVIEQFKMDFDDAYHYTAAEKYNLTIVSFDRHFDGTKLGRKTPGEIVKAR